MNILPWFANLVLSGVLGVWDWEDSPMLICILPFVCGLGLLLLAFYLLVDFAGLSIIAENLTLGDGIRRAWGLMREKIGSIIGMILILIIVQILMLTVLLLPFILLLAAVYSTGMQRLGENPIVLIVSLCGGLPLILMLVQTYGHIVWALFYRRLAYRPAEEEMIPEGQALV